MAADEIVCPAGGCLPVCQFPENETMNLRRWTWVVLLFAAGFAQAQAPVEERGNALSQGQYRAGVAWRDLEQARYDAKLAEQDVLNLRDAHAAAQLQADQRKRELDAAQKAWDAARGKLAATQKAYDQAVDAVDAAHRAPAAPSK